MHTSFQLNISPHAHLSTHSNLQQRLCTEESARDAVSTELEVCETSSNSLLFTVQLNSHHQKQSVNLVPRLLPSFLSHTVSDKKLGRSLGTRLWSVVYMYMCACVCRRVVCVCVCVCVQESCVCVCVCVCELIVH